MVSPPLTLLILHHICLAIPFNAETQTDTLETSYFMMFSSNRPCFDMASHGKSDPKAWDIFSLKGWNHDCSCQFMSSTFVFFALIFGTSAQSQLLYFTTAIAIPGKQRVKQFNLLLSKIQKIAINTNVIFKKMLSTLNGS